MRCAIIQSPGGAAQGFTLCRPSGALFSGLTHTHRLRSGLRSFVPDGTCQDNKRDSLNCETNSQRISCSSATFFSVREFLTQVDAHIFREPRKLEQILDL